MEGESVTFLLTYNRKHSHQGQGTKGRAPWQAFKGGLPPPKTTTASITGGTKGSLTYLRHTPKGWHCQVTTRSVQLGP